jgi:MoxR-like ATPase
MVNSKKTSLFKVLHGMYHAGIPTMVFSEPGMGKTASIRHLAKTLNKKMKKMASSLITDVEVMGLPFTEEKNGKKEVSFSVPEYIQDLNDNPGSILFFDEITTAPVSIQKMLLTLIQDCELNTFTIPESTFRVAAGNYANIHGSETMSLALMNRMASFHWDFDMDEFLEGWISGWTNYEYAEITTDKEQLEKKYLDYHKIIYDFLKTHRDCGHRMPEEIINREDVSYCSPRSWDNLCRALCVLDKNDDEYIQCIIEGIIGPYAGLLFFNYMKKQKTFDIDLTSYYGKEDELVLPDPNKADQVYFIVKLTMMLLSMDPNKWQNLWIRVMNLVYNKDKKFGDYLEFDTLRMKSVTGAVDLLLNQDIQMHEKQKIIRKLAEEVDDWNDLHSSAVTIIGK